MENLKFVFCVIIILLALVYNNVDGKRTYSKAPYKRHRGGKFLFNIVKFRNDVCNSSAENEQGVCYTSSECSSRGGRVQGSCAAGFGVCCTFPGSCYDVKSEKVAYFRNPSYPDSDNTPNYCSYSAKVTDRDVCQIRMDFEVFNMSPPSMDQVPFGQCSGDRLAIFASQNKLGLSEGNLVCGDMTDQHIYVPTNATQGEDNVSLFAMVGTTYFNASFMANYTWSIRIEQIDCTINHEKEAPTGCLQYFTDLSGTLESFNFRNELSAYPIEMDYAICFRARTGFCGLTLTTLTAGDAFRLNTNDIGRPFGEACYPFHGNTDNSSADFLQVMGGYSMINLTYYPASHFCGNFGDLTATVPFPGIMTSFSPLVLRFRSDDTIKFAGPGGQPALYPNEAQQILATGAESGFRLSYSLTTNCPSTF